MGKWQCPSCAQGNDQPKPINHLDSISKRARSKIVPAKAKNGVSSLNTEKVSPIFGSTLISKKRSSSKGKSISTVGAKQEPLSSSVDVTCSNKPSDPSLVSSMEGTSSCANAHEEKKSDVPSSICPTDRKSNSTADEVLPTTELANLEADDEQLEGKRDLPCDEMPLRKPIVLAISAATGVEQKKRKLKVNNNDSQKKRKTEKGKSTVNSSIKCKSGNNKVHKKQKSLNKSVSASLSKEDVGIKGSDAEQKDEVSFSLAEYFFVCLVSSIVHN